eukprot:1714931-Alexandrium_andersonii.AAC.1
MSVINHVYQFARGVEIDAPHLAQDWSSPIERGAGHPPPGDLAALLHEELLAELRAAAWVSSRARRAAALDAAAVDAVAWAVGAGLELISVTSPEQ